MYYSYVEIEYVATSFSPARTDLALKLLNGDSNSIDIIAVLSNTSIGMVHYQYCHCLVPIPVLAFWYIGSVSLLTRSITGTGI